MDSKIIFACIGLGFSVVASVALLALCCMWAIKLFIKAKKMNQKFWLFLEWERDTGLKLSGEEAGELIAELEVAKSRIAELELGKDTTEEVTK